MDLKRTLAGLAIPALILVAGCEAKLPAVGYSAPTDSEAEDAYRSLVLSKHVDGSSADEVAQRVVEKDGEINGMNYYAVSAAQARESHNDFIEKYAKDLQSAKVSDCAWARFKPGEVKAKYDEKAFGARPEAAYRCKVVVTVDTDTRGLMEGPTDGFFIRKDDGDFIFVGPMATQYKRLDGKEDEPVKASGHAGQKWI